MPLEQMVLPQVYDFVGIETCAFRIFLVDPKGFLKYGPLALFAVSAAFPVDRSKLAI
jgi:hypothetical protein